MFSLDYHIVRLYRNELNTFDGKNYFADLVFETREGILLNFEFQDTKIKESDLKRYMDYKVFLQCQSGIPVVTVIICTHHVKSEVYIYNETETSLLKPLIRYLFDYDDEVKYLSFKNKIKTNSKFNHHEVQFLVFSPFITSRRFRQDKVRDVCALIEEIKEKELFDDTELYLPLILAIKQYVSDEEEQKKLMEVLTMDMSADEIYEKVMNSGIYEHGIDVGLKRGIEQGMEKGKFDMAIEIKNKLGIDEAIRLSGFSRRELENESLDG